MEFVKEDNIEAVVSIHCAVCGQKFRMNDEVKQIVIGKLGWLKDVAKTSDGWRDEWSLAIINGDIADVHVRCSLIS